MEYMSKWISTGEAGRMLGVSTVTITRLIRDGKIAGQKTRENGHYRVRPESVIEYQKMQENSEQKGTADDRHE